MKHYPVRTDTTPGKPTRYTGLCGYTSTNAKEFCNPAHPEKATCEGCRDYDKLPKVKTWAEMEAG